MMLYRDDIGLAPWEQSRKKASVSGFHPLTEAEYALFFHGLFSVGPDKIHIPGLYCIIDSKQCVQLLFHRRALPPSVHFQEGVLHSNQRRASDTIIPTFFFLLMVILVDSLSTTDIKQIAQ